MARQSYYLVDSTVYFLNRKSSILGKSPMRGEEGVFETKVCQMEEGEGVFEMRGCPVEKGVFAMRGCLMDEGALREKMTVWLEGRHRLGCLRHWKTLLMLDYYESMGIHPSSTGLDWMYKYTKLQNEKNNIV